MCAKKKKPTRTAEELEAEAQAALAEGGEAGGEESGEGSAGAAGEGVGDGEAAEPEAEESAVEAEDLNVEALEGCLSEVRKLKGQVAKHEEWIAWAKLALAKAGKWLPIRLPKPPE